MNLRIDPELKAAAERAAEADRRSLTAYIEKLIEDDVARRETARRPDFPNQVGQPRGGTRRKR